MTYFLAYKLSATQYGEFTLTQAIFSYSLYAVGLDFYLYSNRYIIKNIKNSKRASIAITSQFSVNLIGIILITIPFIIYMFSSEFNILLTLLLLSLILVDSLTQEVTRILEIVGDQKSVSEISLLRFGLGSLFVVGIFLLNFTSPATGPHTLFFIYIPLIISSTTAFFWGLNSIKYHTAFDLSPPSFYFIKKGFLNVPKYIIGTLSYRGLFSLDKIIIGFYCNKAILSWYGFICLTLSGIQLIQDVTISAYLYPKIMKHGICGENRHMYLHTKKMAYYNALSSIILGIGICVFFYFLQNKMPIAKQVMNNIEIVLILIAGYTFNSISTPYHYVLYAKNKLTLISTIHSCSLASFLTFILVFSIHGISPTTISFSLLLSFLGLFFARYKYSGDIAHD